MEAATGESEAEDAGEADPDADAVTLYWLWHDPAAAPEGALHLHGDAHPFGPGMWLVRSPLTRSKLYHRIKWQLPEGTPLACAPLGDDPAGWPKFKGMETGALGWLRGG